MQNLPDKGVSGSLHHLKANYTVTGLTESVVESQVRSDGDRGGTSHFGPRIAAERRAGTLSVFLVVRGAVIGLQLAQTITRPDEPVSRESTMRRFTNCIFTLGVAVLLVATWGCNKSETPSAAPGAAAAVDRTVLPLGAKLPGDHRARRSQGHATASVPS